MPRPEKVQAVAEIKARLERAEAVFLAEYAGLSVKQQQTLRRGLRERGAEFKVVKMTLARRAAAELDLSDLDDLFLGPTGIAFADGDPVDAAKALRDFARENEAFSLKGGLLGSEFLTPERVSELADIESRDVLLSKAAGLLQAPMANMAGLLAALPRNLASALQQLIDKRDEPAAGSPAPEPSAVAEEESTSTDESGDAVAAEVAAVEATDPPSEDDAEEAVAGDEDGDDAKSNEADTAEAAEED
jgi:large subunit ribosomal protein L10